MIYLIEDKTSRRNDYGWQDKRIKQYKDAIHVIDNVSTLSDNMESLLSQESVLLFHESFANAADYCQKKEVTSFLKDVESKGIRIAYFSGSKSQRTLDNNVCNLPPHVLYANLEHFINKFMGGDTDFKYLLFGKNPELEDKLRESIIKINTSNVGCEKTETSKNLFFFTTSTSDESLDPPYENITINDTIDWGDEKSTNCDDTYLSNIINQNFKTVKYDGIFIPLCFGETLSDFLGLRLAMLIRFSKTLNNLTPIIIYGEADYKDMISNECFDILKMAGVYYIHSDYKSINAIQPFLNDITESEYNSGLSNIHLNIPSDIGDNHSVSNKWAIHRWAHALNISDEDEFKSVEDKVINSLYFKYLYSINSFKKNDNIVPKNLVMNISAYKRKPKVLFIDDQADEGWYEALCYILHDKNGIDLDYIGDELKAKTNEEIIDIVKERISSYSPDIVILDLRLCPSDFTKKTIKDLTGNRVLRLIKQINRGIQVLMFSSTNTIWNYQYLSSQESNIDGADGFIVKERPEDSKDLSYTKTIIKHFVKSVEQCSNHIFRKDIWEKTQDDIRKCTMSDSDYGKALTRLLELVMESLFVKQANLPYASIFMNLFRIVEATANQFIDDCAITDVDGMYYFQFKDGSKLLKFTNEGKLLKGETFKSEKKNLPYLQKICNTIHALGTYSNDTFEIVKKRNNFTHPNMSKQKELEEFDVHDVLNAFDLVNNLIQNQKKI